MSEAIRPTDYVPPGEGRGGRFRLPTVLQALGIVVFIAIAAVLWFLFSATAIQIETNVAPETPVQIEFSGALVVPSGPSFLVLDGTYSVAVTAPGYRPVTQTIEVGDGGNSTFLIELTPTPGILQFQSKPEGATITVDGIELGVTPLSHPIEPGARFIQVSTPRYLAHEREIEVLGRGAVQSVDVTLDPDWANVYIHTDPSAGRVRIDGVETGFLTPGPIEIPSGERRIGVKKIGYRLWEDIVFVRAGEERTLPPVMLELIGGTLRIRTEPAGATVTINGSFAGVAPLNVDLTPDRSHRVDAVLAGYQPAVRNVELRAEAERVLRIDLQPVTAELVVETDPPEAAIWLDGQRVGTSNATLTLQARQYELELRKDGYAGYQRTLQIQPEFPQQVQVKLLTLEEARLEALKQVRQTSDGQALVLLSPGPIRMGASRREPGRRANEVFRTSRLERLFYLATHEVTNAHFKAFASGHDSGEFQGSSLRKDAQPVVNVSWREAAQYCNWLSEQEGFQPFYVLSPGSPTEVDENSLGYRMPTEAEWTWAARHVDGGGLLHYPWGEELPPPQNHGNYADRTAQHVIGRVIFDYNDNFLVSAEVGRFRTSDKGLYDIGGNVAEWTSDFYDIPAVNAIVSPMGPKTGEYRVIRGSSWKHGTITDLRLSFRDYGVDGRDDVGFRIARFAE